MNGMSHYEHDLREGEPPPLPTEPARQYPTHPLFPLAEGVRETKEIHEITFDRWNEKGLKERCPDRFSSSELTSLAHVVDMFGGGTYQFIAFDSRGNFSRWTPEKEKIRVDLPSKPFRQIERAEAPTQEIHQQPARPTASPTADYMGVLMQQSIAAQERADRFMAALFERLATPPPTPDPILMLSGLAAVLEKIRPAQAGDMVSQLSGLATIVKQLKGSQPESSSPSSSPEDMALQPFLTMMTNAMLQKPAGGQQPGASPPPQPTPSASPPLPPADLVWVLLPEHGPVLMRHEQASRALARPVAAALPPASAPNATAATQSPAAAPIAYTAAGAPVPSAVSAPVAIMPSPAPVASAPAASASASTPAAPTPAPTPAASTSAPSALPPAPTPVTERCIVCGEPGRCELGQPNLLICRYGHRSLMAEPPAAPAPAAASPQRSLLPLDGGSITISPADLDAMLSDPDVRQALSPEIAAALEQVRAHIGRS